MKRANAAPRPGRCWQPLAKRCALPARRGTGSEGAGSTRADCCSSRLRAGACGRTCSAGRIGRARPDRQRRTHAAIGLPRSDFRRCAFHSLHGRSAHAPHHPRSGWPRRRAAARAAQGGAAPARQAPPGPPRDASLLARAPPRTRRRMRRGRLEPSGLCPPCVHPVLKRSAFDSLRRKALTALTDAIPKEVRIPRSHRRPDPHCAHCPAPTDRSALCALQARATAAAAASSPSLARSAASR